MLFNLYYKEMKKVVLFFAVCASVALSSCGNTPAADNNAADTTAAAQADTTAAQADTTAAADSTSAPADSAKADSTAAK